MAGELGFGLDMTTETTTKWAIEADYYQACNCDYGCPCEYEAPPTMGFCEGMGAYKITKGKYGDVSLDGLGFAYGIRSKAAIHLGDCTLVIIIDEQANAEQREALLNITHGKDGGIPFEIIVQLVSNLIDPIYTSFEFNANGEHSSVKLGDIGLIELEPIKNPVTGDPESMRLEHATGFIFKGADIVAAKEGKLKVDGLDFSYPDKAGFVTTVNYSN